MARVDGAICIVKEAASFANLVGGAQAIKRGLSPKTIAWLKAIASTLKEVPPPGKGMKQIPTSFSSAKNPLAKLLKEEANGVSNPSAASLLLNKILSKTKPNQDLSRYVGLNDFSMRMTGQPFNRAANYLKRRPVILKEYQADVSRFPGDNTRYGAAGKNLQKIYYNGN